MVQGDGFHKLLEKLDPCYQLPSQKTLSNKVIPALYVSQHQRYQSLISLNNAKFVVLTSDCWTSRVNQSYINITLHFLKTKSVWMFEHFVLESKELPGNHTAEHLAEAIKECMHDWNIEESNLSGITIDNTSNIVKAVEQVLEWPYLPCFGHTLNLAVKAGLAIPRMQRSFQNTQTL